MVDSKENYKFDLEVKGLVPCALLAFSCDGSLRQYLANYKFLPVMDCYVSRAFLVFCCILLLR